MKENTVVPGKKLLLFLALVLAAWGVIYFYQRGDNQGGRGVTREQAIVGVNTALVERRDLVETRVFSGTLIAEKRYDAAVKISGRVREIAVNLGDCIDKGDLIARLDSEEYEQQLAQARAEIDV
ncbi:MAG: biotin/lipoyl-binding protein, partial [Desulfofustis sp.]|nr:biotin/lipoyl-binding protein [Desulfofustis sp.]